VNDELVEDCLNRLFDKGLAQYSDGVV